MMNYFTFFVSIILSLLIFSCSEENNTNSTKQEFIDMVEIPTGIFEMGNTVGDPSEVPTHPVKITREFYISKHEITQKAFKTVTGKNPSIFKDKENNPVENITWVDAVLFCNELSVIENLKPCYTIEEDTLWVCNFNNNGYRLPTEAEWEYVCRAGTTKNYDDSSEESYLDSIGWYKNNSNNSTQPVGNKKPNPFNICDMHGNVSEMVWDFYHTYTKDYVENPVGPKHGLYHVIRGGSFKNEYRYCRASNRLTTTPLSSSSEIGFRIARSK